MSNDTHDIDADARSLDGYSSWSRLGSGGFSVVLAARRDRDGADVAIKVALRAGDRRFLREASALRRIVGPAAPALIDSGTTRAGHPYLVMERVLGQPLSAWLAALARRPLALRLMIAAATARALSVVHAAQVVHRDLKPANVILRDDGGASASGEPALPSVTLIDFGLARVEGSASAEVDDPGLVAELTAEGARLGTILYMSPEQCEGLPADNRADIYSLGVILFELLVGRPPFDGDASSIAMAHASRRPPLPSRLVGTPATLDELVLRCLAKRPEDRFQRAIEVAEAISDTIAAGLPPEDAAPAPARAAAKPTRAPIALLALRTSAPPDRVGRVLLAENRTIARRLDDGYVLAFHGHSSIEGAAQAALALAQAALDFAEDIVIHVSPMIVRETARGAIVMGGALDQVEAWAPRRGAHEVISTPEAAAVLGAQASSISRSKSSATESVTLERSTIGGARSSLDPMPDVTAPLRGRRPILDAICAEAETSLCGTPGLCTIVGDIGHGRTRLLEELASALAPKFASVIALRAASPEQGEAAGLVRSLLELTLGLSMTARLSLDAVQRACEARLESTDAAALSPAIAYSLGALDEKDERVARLLATPGALRRALGRALGLSLSARSREAPLALLVDDAQWADSPSLDALEIATLSGTRGALFIAVTVRPAFLAQRPLWGERAETRSTHELPPLDSAATAELVRDLLKPVEFVPDAAVEGLAQATGGVPLNLVEAVHALRISGKVKRRSTGEYFLAADELVQRSVTPLAVRLASRAMNELPPGLRDVLKLASVLGMDVDVSELAAVQLRVESALPSTSSDEAMDIRVALDRLARRGVLLSPSDGRFRFRHAMLRDAIEELLSPGLKRVAHEAAYRLLSALDERHVDVLPRVARHAAAAGMAEQAADAYLELAERAARMHSHVNAEQHYSSALSLLPPTRVDDRERALAGRGQARAILERFDDALEDLKQAQTLAAARGDDRTVASLLLDEATLHDLGSNHAASAEAMQQAAPLVERLNEARLVARLTSARGRTHCRRNRRGDAVVDLRRAASLAFELGDTRTQTESLLLLSTSLVAEGHVDEAAKAFDDVIALCERTGDRFHLGVAHLNRIWLWSKLHDYARAVADQRIAISLGREIGNTMIESYATGNIAELWYFCGSYEEAVAPARRMLEVFRRIHGRVIPAAAIIAARVEAAAGHASEALALVEDIRSQWPPDKLTGYSRALMRLVEIVAGDPLPDEPAQWDAVLEELRSCNETHERIDAIYQASRRAVDAGRISEARRRIAEALAESPGPMWQGRFTELSDRLPAGDNAP